MTKDQRRKPRVLFVVGHSSFVVSRDHLFKQSMSTRHVGYFTTEIRTTRRNRGRHRFEALQDWECPDSRSGGDLAEEVRQYFIPDFTAWRSMTPLRRPSRGCGATSRPWMPRHRPR